MQEIIDQAIDYLKGIWIRRRYIIIATWLICPLGWYKVSQLPDVYKSSAKIYVDTQSILRPLLRGMTINTNPDTQVTTIVRQLLSQPNLERIYRMVDLDVQAESESQKDGLISRLKGQIKISKSKGLNIFTISVTDQNPEMAKNIVQATLTVFKENTLGESRVDTDTAHQFLDKQIAEYENRLSEAESRRTQFKQKYSEILSVSTGGYYQTRNAAKRKLKSAELSLAEAQSKLASINQQLKTAAQPQSDFQKNISQYNIPTSFDSRIKTLENKLDTLLLRYTDNYPEVKETKRLLLALNTERENTLKAHYESLAKNEDGSFSGQSSIEANPVYRELKIQANKHKSEISSLTVRVNNYKAQVKDLENKIFTVPEIMQEANALDRGYSITKRKYEEILARKETALLAQQADETTDKINFRTLEPPKVPKKPSGPKRTLYFQLVAVAGVLFGMAISLLMSLVNPIVTSGTQLTAATGIPIFGAISANENLGLQRWHKRKTVLFMFSNIVLIGILLMFIGYFLYPDLAQEQLQRIF